MGSIRAVAGAGLALAACAGLMACADPAAAAARVASVNAVAADSPSVSSNWSGYAVSAAADPTTGVVPDESFTDIVGSWVEPRATCKSGASAASAFWVGLGGFAADSQALEQIGTEADCTSSGKPSYGVWYEIVPAGAVRVKLKILPGDRINAAVLVNGPQVTFSLRDLTRHTRFSRRLTPPGPLDLGSAEWIAEAPSECSSSGRCRVLPLANFGTVSFTKASTTGNGHDGTISDPAWAATPVELVTGAGPLGGAPGSGAVPADLSPDGTAFSVAWRASVTPRG